MSAISSPTGLTEVALTPMRLRGLAYHIIVIWQQSSNPSHWIPLSPEHYALMISLSAQWGNRLTLSSTWTNCTTSTHVVILDPDIALQVFSLWPIILWLIAGMWLRSQLANFSQFWSKFCHLWDQCKSSEKGFPCIGDEGLCCFGIVFQMLRMWEVSSHFSQFGVRSVLSL